MSFTAHHIWRTLDHEPPQSYRLIQARASESECARLNFSPKPAVLLNRRPRGAAINVIGDYSKPSWNPRFGELDNLIAEQNRQEKKSKNLVTITDAEHTQRQIEHTARVKREVGARAQAKKKLLALGEGPEAGGSEGLRMIEAHLRPGYTALATLLKNGREPKEWDALVTNILQLPLWMLPAVQIVMSKGSWRMANDPLKSVRENARREAIRVGLKASLAHEYTGSCGIGTPAGDFSYGLGSPGQNKTSTR